MTVLVQMKAISLLLLLSKSFSGFQLKLKYYYRFGYELPSAIQGFEREKGRTFGMEGAVNVIRFRGDTKEKIDLDDHVSQSPLISEGNGRADLSERQTASDFTFECRKCHAQLGNASSVHNVTSVDIFSETGSMFVEQLKWMLPQSSQNEVSGKLYCSKCKEKLGSYNWSGASTFNFSSCIFCFRNQ